MTRVAVAALALALSAPVSAQEDPFERTLDVAFEEPVTVEAAYALLSAVTGLRFVFDEGVRRDEKIQADVQGLTVARALDLIELIGGLARAPHSSGAWVVFPDNMTKRREYEPQAVRTFYLQHADSKAVNALLRGIVDVRKTAVDEALHAITVRDSVAKIALAAELVERLDVAPGEAELRVELWTLGADAASSLRRALTVDGVSGTRLAAAEVERFRKRKEVRALLDTSLALRDGGRAVLHLNDPPPAGAASSEGDVPAGFHLIVRPRMGHERRELDLEVECEVRLAAPGEAGRSRTSERSVTHEATLPEDEALVSLGLGRVSAGGSTTAAPLYGAGSDELALVLTPRIVRLATVAPENLAALEIGTERRLRDPARE